MKILVDCREIQTHITGIARIMLIFFKGVKSFNTDIEFILLGDQHTDFEKEELKGYKKIMLRNKNTLYFDQIKVLQIINECNVDLFFSPYYKFPVFAKIPVITSMFDVMYLVLNEYKNLKSFYIKNFVKLTYNRVKKVITSSYCSKNDLIKILKLSEEKIEVVYLSVDDKFQPQSTQKINEIKQKYGINKKYILYVGNSKPHKNLNRLIEAYNLLPENIKNEYQLVLAGVSQLQTEISTPILHRGCSYKFRTPNSKLLTLNFIPDEDLPALYSGAELFVFPSLYEGFGLPPLEAMSCGCPVVASNVSSLPEVLGDAALYFDPYDVKDICDKILLALENKQICQDLVSKGFNYVKKFKNEKMIQRLLDILSN